VFVRAAVNKDCSSPVFVRAAVNKDCSSPVFVRAAVNKDCSSGLPSGIRLACNNTGMQQACNAVAAVALDACASVPHIV